jgi:autotransporter-associated beta strand protein
VNNNNDTTAGTTYGPITFTTGSSAFTLNGNPIALGGGIVNNSANPQTVDLGLTFSSPYTLSGASSTLIIGGGLTNTAAGTNSIVLSGTGILTNLFGDSDPAGTNTFLMTDPKANWVLVDNATSSPMTNAWPINIQAGSFTIGLSGNAPTWTSTSINGAPQDDQVGIISNTVATLTLSNGTFTTGARLNTATVLNSTGIVNQVSGTFNIHQQFQGANGGGAGEQSFLNVSGGTMSIDSGAGQIYVASRGGGVFNMNGGTAVCATLDVSRNANGNTIGSIGVVNLNGGVLSLGRVGTATANSQAGPPSSGTQPTATFNFNGGTLLANTNVGANPFFQGSLSGPAIPITTTVRSGGAIIDDGGNAISILEPLRHDSTLGNTLDGGLQKNGAGTLTLGAANTYTGPTVVNNGTLFVSGSLAATAVTVGNNGTLAGTGSLGSNATVNGTISPNGTNALGTLTIASNLVLQGTATAIMEVSKTSLTNDVLKANSITYGGTLAVTNLGGTLAPGDAFKLFSANSYGGSFTGFALASPGSGLAWDTSGLTNGVLRVVATVNPNPTNITFTVGGGNLTLNWPADHTGWHLQVQTNTLQVGINTNWVEVPGTSSTNQIVFPIVSTNPTVFYRLFLPH